MRASCSSALRRLCVVGASTAPAQTEQATAKPNSKQPSDNTPSLTGQEAVRKALLKEPDGWNKRGNKLDSENKINEAIAAAENILSIERKLVKSSR